MSDGSIKPLSPQEERELREHINPGHVKKSNLCKGCLLSEGPRKLHKRVRDVDKATHVLHIDIAGPYIESHEGHHYFLVGALRLPDRPLLIDVRLLKTRTSVEVCAALERMTSFFESLSFEGFEITGSPRIKRLHSDALYFQKFLSNHRSIYHTLTTGYDPQANGTAERSVGLMKALSARCLTTSGLPQEFWGYAVKHAAQSLLCSSLQKKQKSPPFGSQVIAQVLNHKKVKYPEQRSISGRLLYWDHLQDQLSYLLCPSEEENEEPKVQRAALPVLAPPESPQPKATFGTPLKNDNPGHSVDLDMDDMVVPDEKQEEEDDDDVDENIELDELEGTPFTYFYLSAEESPQVLNAEEDDEDDDVILTEEPSPPVNTAKDLDDDEGRKQATTHISVFSRCGACFNWRRKREVACCRKKGVTSPSPKPSPRCHHKRGQLSRRRLNLRGRISSSCQQKLSSPSSLKGTRSGLWLVGIKPQTHMGRSPLQILTHVC